MRNRLFLRVGSIIALGIGLADCGMAGLIGSAKDSMKIAEGCPDLSSTDSIAKIDFGDEFALDAPAAAKVRAGVIATAALKDLAAGIDADLKTGCSGLAKDLGAGGEFATGVAACEAAGKAMADEKAKMGANVVFGLEVKEPVCSISLGLVSDCAAKCDASLKGAKANVECEGGEISGKCDGECTGKCEMSAPATCDGVCDGTCDAQLSGQCSGICDGLCDGKKKPKGTCAGKCEGRCDLKAKGECTGKCGGTCEMSNGSKCDGTCAGSCSIDFKEPMCSGTVVPPKISADCKTSCDASASANLSCTPALINVKITGAKDLEAAAKYKAAIEANLPRILKVAIGIVPRLGGVLSNVKTTLEGGITTAQAAAKGRATAGAHILQCLVTPFKGAIDSVTGVEASISVSVDIKGAAATSGSATSG